MVNRMRISNLVFMVGVGALVASCELDDGRPSYPSYGQTLFGLAEADSRLRAFVALVEKAGLDGALDGDQASLTVFAPTDGAIAALGDLDGLSPREAGAIVRFHIAAGTLPASVVALGDVRTITSTTIGVREAEGTLVLDDRRGHTARVVASDAFASNGVLHVIDAVLERPIEDLARELYFANRFDALLGVVKAASRTATFAEGGPLTLLAPNDAAFEAVGDLSAVRASVLENILLHHVVLGPPLDEATLAANPRLTSEAHLPLIVRMNGAEIEGASVVERFTASNGVFLEIDRVIIPPTNVAFLESAGLTRTSTAIAQLPDAVRAKVTPKTLDGEAPVTLFAPTDSAWEATGLDLAAVGTSTLAAVLGAHVHEGQVLTEDLASMDGKKLTMIGGTLTVEVQGDQIELVDERGHRAKLAAESDIRTTSGVVHIIDAVLGR